MKLLHTNYNGQKVTFVIENIAAIVGFERYGEQRTNVHLVASGDTIEVTEPYELIIRKIESEINLPNSRQMDI